MWWSCEWEGCGGPVSGRVCGSPVSGRVCGGHVSGRDVVVM